MSSCTPAQLQGATRLPVDWAPPHLTSETQLLFGEKDLGWLFFFFSLFYLLENFLFLLEYNCFPMLRAFLLYREGSQLRVYMYPLCLESSSRPP